MADVARYERVYHRKSKDFKDKNKKANCWEIVGKKFNLSVAEAEVKFRNKRTAYGRYMKSLKNYSLPETQSSLTKVWKAPCSCVFKNILRTQNRCCFAMRFCGPHKAPAILTLPLTKM